MISLTDSFLDHQRTISKLTVELGVLFYGSRSISLMPLPQTSVNGGSNHPLCDVILYDETVERTRVIVEVCNNRSVNSDLRKVIRLIEEDDFGIQEGFVFNYVTREWLRYRKGDGAVRRSGAAMASSFSDLMGVDLGPMV